MRYAIVERDTAQTMAHFDQLVHTLRTMLDSGMWEIVCDQSSLSAVPTQRPEVHLSVEIGLRRK